MEGIKITPEFQLETPETITEHIKELVKNPLEERINLYRIRPTDKILLPQKAWEQSNTSATLGTLGNFSLIIGKAKSKKSFFINIAVSTVLNTDETLGQFRGALPYNKRKVLYFDTEQGKYHVQLALKRVCKQINIEEPQDLEVFGLRSAQPSERLAFIEEMINSTPNLGFVIIDGIKDLINSINDEGEATMIASKLLKWTEEHNIHIMTVLHQNKSDNNARGHIGTELINKAETVLSVTKDERDSSISVVEAQQCRNREPESFAFQINDEGLPIIVEDYQPKSESKRENKNALLEIEPNKQFKILIEVFSHNEDYSYSSLVEQIKLAYKKVFQNNIGDNKVKTFVTHCKNKNWIIQKKEKAPYNIGQFQGLDDS